MNFKRPIRMIITVVGISGFLPFQMSQHNHEVTLVNLFSYDEIHPENPLYQHVKEHTQAEVSSRTTLSVDVSDTLTPADSATVVTTP